MHELIEISGILAFLSFIAAATTGVAIFKFHVKWVNMKWHMYSAAAALVFAVTHVVLVMLR